MEETGLQPSQAVETASEAIKARQSSLSEDYDEQNQPKTPENASFDHPEISSLISQQFRLRDLVRITGHGFVCPTSPPNHSVQFYYTLHKAADPDALFSSQKCNGLVYPPLFNGQTTITGLGVFWPDIKKDFEPDSPRQSVVIRVWQCDKTKDECSENKIIACYGIHFSGLVPYSDRLLYKLRPNSLVLHTRSGYSYISPDCFTNYLDTESNDSLLSGVNNSDPSPSSLSCSSTSNDCTGSFLHPKYKTLTVLSTTVQQCCSLDQLLKLQQSQLRLKYKRELLRSLIMEIKSKSAFCMDDEFLRLNPASFVVHHHNYQRQNHHSGQHSHSAGTMGKTLTRLLNMEPERVDPQTLLDAFKLRMKIEAVKVRCRMLATERDRARQHVRRLEGQRAINCDRIVETDSAIMAKYHGMSKEKEQYLHLKLTLTKDLETLTISKVNNRARQQYLLRTVEDIYDVREHEGGIFTINGISLPDAEAYDNCHVPVTSINVALGYVAHAVLVASSVLAVPLKNYILFKGSGSQIIGPVQNINTNM